MTAPRDPDRIVRAWLDLMPSEAPDRVVESVLHAVEETPQVRRPVRRAFRRHFQMNRMSFFAVAAAIVVVLAGGGVLLSASRAPSVGNPVATASPSPSPSPSASVTPAQAPEAMRGTWVADLGPAPSPAGSSRLIRLVVASARLSLLVDGQELFVSGPVAGPFDELDIASTTAGGCQLGDVGRYRYAFGSDGTTPGTEGTLLGLTAVADGCPARQSMLERSWVHVIDGDNAGGRGVATEFSPMFMVTLPQKTYASQHGADGLTLDASDGYAFVATRNPWGWTEPCSATGGAKRQLAPSAPAFAAYLATLPGVTIQNSTTRIDGHPATHLRIATTKTPECERGGPTNGRMNEWTTSDPANTGGWFVLQGETDSLYLVEVEGSLFLLQWLGPNVSGADELQVLSTVHFIDALPGAS